ncbi:beta-galactosidase [Halobacillus andaensis]|uniref:Beta-galactosidase n=1 Tax=Halobacillus andaensis TaxID=1176239 RepID=A0A917BAA3_HALAA|nr:beta-galactosidase [Halobacillus andaensis]MBP2005355.1 beta-galactosidase [Halobacillus andaensis]GGF30846.1 beta-galactosidase [Halobacillus andaensis]
MPYLGVDYYPEHWPDEMITEDIKGIKDLGANIVRIGEFAWHLMEPEEGKFDFSYFDSVISELKEHGLKVMFGTPTATFPAWLAHQHPSILSENENGQVRVFGGRRQYCFNSEVYRKYARTITKRLAEHYSDEPAIVSWQIDNEFGHEGSDQCYCEKCHEKFQEFLKHKYKSIDTLNETWGTIFWGQTYNDFNEIPVPKLTITTHNPTLKLDWARFRSHSLNSFTHEMTEIVREVKGEHQTVTTNVSGGFFDKSFDHEENVKKMDFVSYDNYPVWGGLEQPIEPAAIAMTHDFNRGLLNQNYWIVEELMGAQGHDVIGYLPRPNQAKMWSYQAFAHGCSDMLYFRWRGMTKGAEQFCYGVVDHDNHYGRKYKEVQSLFNEIKEYDHVLQSPIEAEVAVLYDYDNIWSWNGQVQSKGFDFNEELLRLYRPFYKLNTPIDVIPSHRELSDYKVVVVPVMQVLDRQLAQKLEQFAETGGTVIFSYRTGLKDRNNNLRLGERLPGPVRKIIGARVEEIESLTEAHQLKLTGKGEFVNTPGEISVWRDLLVPEEADVLYEYSDEFYNQYAAVTENNVGQGTVYYIGGGLNEEPLDRIAKNILSSHGVAFVETPENVEVYERVVDEERYTFVMNHNATVQHYDGEELQPFASKLIKK